MATVQEHLRRLPPKPYQIEAALCADTPDGFQFREALKAEFQRYVYSDNPHDFSARIAFDALIELFRRLPPGLAENQRKLDHAVRYAQQHPGFQYTCTLLAPTLPTAIQLQQATQQAYGTDPQSQLSTAEVPSPSNGQPVVPRKGPAQTYDVEIREAKPSQKRARLTHRGPNRQESGPTVSEAQSFLRASGEKEMPNSLEALDLIIRRQNAIYCGTLDTFLEEIVVPAVSGYVWDRKDGQKVAQPPSNPVTPIASQVSQHANIEDETEPEEELPASYPMIQPLRAARLFDVDPDEIGQWKVLFATKAISDLRQLKDQEKIQVVYKKVTELSKGFFSADNQKPLASSATGVPIFEAKATRDLRIVYQVDIQSEYRTGMDHQILKIWGIETHATIDNRLWSRLSEIPRSKEYVRRCEFRTEAPSRGHKVVNVFTPATWGDMMGEKETAIQGEEQPEEKPTQEEVTQLHEMFTLQKLVPYGNNLRRSILSGDESLTHVFALSPSEQAVVEHDSATFVIGRSGSGKTTTLLFRMIGIEIACRTEMGQILKPRQLFVTKSAELSLRVRDYYRNLLRTFDLEKMSDAEFDRYREHANDTGETGGSLENLEDEEDIRAQLPNKWSELQPHHFPLFLSYDHLCALLEADLDLETSFISATLLNANRNKSAKQFKTKKREKSTKIANPDDLEENVDLEPVRQEPIASATSNKIWQTHVDYIVFKNVYWPHFDARSTKGLDPALCFSEFVGNLGGCIDSLDSDKGYITREQYLAQSERVQGSIKNNRSRIYDLFEKYVQRKKEKCHWDAADRTHTILRKLETLSPEEGPAKVHALFVDESQDNLLVDTELLRAICPTPHNQFFAGDSAQTISSSTFKFDDLKAAWYNAEMNDRLVVSKLRAPVQPEMFHLKVNYRSHQGITELADSVIKILIKYFPHAVDNLGKEKGLVQGPKPTIFTGHGRNLTDFESLVFGGSTNTMDFGADQCIIVRDESTREKLKSRLGEDCGLILTIYESKGLEFTDVVIYHFFDDSPATNEWRVVLREARNYNQAVPDFSDQKHSVILQELKLLYVAVTRARNQCWLYDEGSNSDPMKIMWESRGLVNVWKPGDELPRMAVSSSPDQWRKQGHDLFARQLYRQAANAFRRAGAQIFVETSLAHLERDHARRAQVEGVDAATNRSNFRKVALHFIKCAELSNAQRNRKHENSSYRKAAECAEQAEEYAMASQAHERCGNYTQAAKFARQAERFDDAVRIVMAHKKSVDPVLAENILEIARFFYLDRSQLKQLKALFDNSEQLLTFLEENAPASLSAEMLEELGFYNKAAQAHERARNWKKAATLHEDAGDRRSSIRCHLTIVREATSMNTDLAKQKASMESLLERVSDNLARLNASSSDVDRRRCTGYAFLYKQNRTAAREAWQQASEPALKLLLLDYAIHGQIVYTDPAILENHMQAIQEYAQIIENVILKLSVKDALYPALGLEALQIDSRDILVLPTCPVLSGNDSRVMAKNDVFRAIGLYLAKRLLRVLSSEHQALYNSKALRAPCPNMLVEKKCRHTAEQCEYPHFKEYKKKVYIERLQSILAHIHLFRTCHWLAIGLKNVPSEAAEFRKMPRLWARKLSFALHPFSEQAGSQRSFKAKDFQAHHIASLNEYLMAEMLIIHLAEDAKQQWQLLQNLSGLASFFVPDLGESCFRFGICSPDHAQLRFPDNRPIAQTLFGSLLGIRDNFTALHAKESLSYINYLLKVDDQIDVANTFITILEPLIGCLILSKKPTAGNKRYQHLLLPKPLMQDLLRRNRRKEVPYIADGLDTAWMQSLLEAYIRFARKLIWRKKNLVFENNTKMDPMLAHYFAYRAIRLAVLLAMNVTSTALIVYDDTDLLKHTIMRNFKVLSTDMQMDDRDQHSYFSSFLQATQWTDVATALKSEFAWNTPDRLVQIRYGQKLPVQVGENFAKQHIEHVQVANNEELYDLLLPGEDIEQITESISASVNGTTAVGSVWEGFKPEEINAARFIITWYRKQVTARRQLQSERSSLYQNRLALHVRSAPKASVEQDIQGYRYALLLRGPIACLDTAATAAVAVLNDIDAKVKEARVNNRKLDEMVQKGKVLNKRYRTPAKQLAAILGPGAEVHKHQNLAELRKQIKAAGINQKFVQDVYDFCQDYSASVNLQKLEEAVGNDYWAIGWKGVMEDAKVKVYQPPVMSNIKQARPMVAMDDEYDVD